LYHGSDPLSPPRTEVPMSILHLKHSREHYFHAHPLHGTFSLIASMLLAGLIVLVFVVSAR